MTLLDRFTNKIDKEKALSEEEIGDILQIKHLPCIEGRSEETIARLVRVQGCCATNVDELMNNSDVSNGKCHCMCWTEESTKIGCLN
jgi:hypothetical protein